MAYEIIAGNGSAGNAADEAIYTCPADSTAIIGNVTAYNSTGGTLTLTLKVQESDGTSSTLVSADSLLTTVSASYSGGSTKRITPITLRAGNVLLANGSGAGIKVRASGLRFY